MIVRPLMKQQNLLIAVTVVGGVMGGAWWRQSQAYAARGAGELTASGTIEADEAEVGAQRAARLVAYRVEEGEPVRKGEIIAVLETGEVKAQMEQAQGAVELAAARLAQLLKGARPEEVRRAGGVLSQARAGVGGAQRTLDNAQRALAHRTSLKQALDAAEAQQQMAAAAVKQAEAALAGAEESVRIAQEEHDRNLQLRQARDGARQALQMAEAAQRAANAKLQGLVAGARKEELQAAEAIVAQAGSALRGAGEDLENAASELKRARELHAGKALSDQLLEAAETRAELSRARHSQAEQAKAQADARLLELKNGARKEEIDAARAQLQEAQAAVEGGRRGLENAQEAFDQRLAARAQLELAKTQRSVAQSQLISAQAALAGAELAVRNARTAYEDALQEKQGVDSALTQYQAALGQLETAQAGLEQLRNGATPEEAAQARAQLRQARGALEAARTLQEYSLIRAPADGVVTEQIARVGEIVTPGAAVVKLVSLDRVYLTAYVPLPELGKVKVGQPVRVQADTYPGKSYEGTVARISDTPEFTPRNVQTKDERVKLVYQVRINVRNTERELKPGMPADAEISVRSR